MTAAVSMVAALVTSGCETKSWIDPGELGRYKGVPLVLPILDALVPAFEGGTSDYAASARDVRDGDNVLDNADYRIGPNDFVSVTITDLAGAGTGSTSDTRGVSETGNITLPLLEGRPVKLSGLTEAEAERAVLEAYRQADILQNVPISVVVVQATNRSYRIGGAVNAPRSYPINRGNFRLWDALIDAGGSTSATGIKYIYVIRRTDTGDAASQPAAPAPNPAAPGFDPLLPSSRNTAQPARGAVAARGRAAMYMSSMSMAQPAPEPATTPNAIPGDVEGRSIQIDGAPNTPLSVPGDAAMPPTDPLVPATTPGVLTPLPPIDLNAAASSQPFNFNALALPGDTEVIRVPFAELVNAIDLRYNIVIRPNDTIIVPQPTVGEYYVGGHVQQGGVFSLTARNITLKQAVLSARGLDLTAIPQRTEIVRRLSDNSEMFVRVDLDKIAAGLAPDFYLKPDDQIMVGTNALAPFIAAFRNAFRITYGFGFLYDRNYAPIRNDNNN